MERKLCYRGATYEVETVKKITDLKQPDNDHANQLEYTLSVSHRTPVILRYRGVLYISGDLDYTEAFLKI